MNYYYYLTEEDRIIRVIAKRKPSVYTVSSSGTWVVYEYVSGISKWIMPAFPEIIWRTLKEFIYIGKTPYTKEPK